MKDTFEYICIKEALDSISIDDTGNVCLAALNDAGSCWYLQIETHLGDTIVTEYGPLSADEMTFNIFGFNYNKSKFIYNEKKLHTIIDKFLNNPRRVITQVTEISDYEFKAILDEIRDQF